MAQAARSARGPRGTLVEMLPVTGKVDRQRARYCLLTLLRSHAGIICGLHLQVQPPARFRSAFRRVCINVNIYAAARGGGRPMVQCLLQHPAHQPQPKTTVKRPRTGASARRHMRAATSQTVTKHMKAFAQTDQTLRTPSHRPRAPWSGCGSRRRGAWAPLSRAAGRLTTPG